MKSQYYTLFCSIIFVSAVTYFLNVHAETTFIPRSQGDNTAREIVGWQRQLFKCYDDNYGVLATTIAYTRSFKSQQIARRFFSTSCLTFTGSKFPVREPNDIVADYFGLATNFKGALVIKPRIQNTIVDLNFYFGLDGWCDGFYLRVNAPITHTSWTLGLNSCLSCDDSTRGCFVFPPCYMSSVNEIPSDQNCPSPVKQIVRTPPKCPINTTLHPPVKLRNDNCTAPNIRDALSGNFTFGDMTEPWEFGKFSFCSLSKTGLADLDISLGWNYIHNDCAHAGVFIVTVIPTGNRPKAKYIFEPLVGDGRHWHLGAGFSGHYSLYQDNEYTCFNIGIYVDARLVNVFKTDQIRSFDFINNGLLSRYILLKEFDQDGVYIGNMINAINFTTRNCEVSVGLQADISAKFFTRYNGWELDIGYNFYQRDCEKICLKTNCPCPLDSRIFGIKGVEGVCCIPYDVANKLVIPNPKGDVIKKRIDTTQPDATMFDPELPVTAPLPPDDANEVCLTWNSKVVTPEDEPLPVDKLIERGFIIADENAVPQRVTCADLDIDSAEQGRMRTHKVFGHISYTYKDGCHCPFIGIGAEGEFDGCNNNALEQWGIWLKIGISF